MIRSTIYKILFFCWPSQGRLHHVALRVAIHRLEALADGVAEDPAEYARNGLSSINAILPNGVDGYE